MCLNEHKDLPSSEYVVLKLGNSIVCILAMIGESIIEPQSKLSIIDCQNLDDENRKCAKVDKGMEIVRRGRNFTI